jgi:GNAT superfamily N-acetyltransferase
MRAEISEEPFSTIEEYAAIPIAFEVGAVLDVAEVGNSPGGFVLTERVLDHPYVKDYDANDAEIPAQWAQRFDISNWGLFIARREGLPVGGAVVAFNTPGLVMLEDRTDLAVLWDIRVCPEVRGQGVGAALFHVVEAWARARNCRQLKVETQNINVKACRFYAKQGCALGAVNRLAYPELPDEIQLLWYRDLSSPRK